MAILRRQQLIEGYNRTQSKLFDDDFERAWAAGLLKVHADAFDRSATYDVFLSHSYSDARLVKQIYELLRANGHTVYVDWIEDSTLNRNAVTTNTATVIRDRMNRCNSLLYLTSEAAEHSVWMPWELGYMDARTGRVAVAPILDEAAADEFDGREYLGLYPYLDLTGDSFYIHRDRGTWISLKRWMTGEQPTKHS